MKHILLPTDFSDNAWNATAYAIELFKNQECTFYLLNTYTPAIANSRFMASSINGGILEKEVHLFSQSGLNNLLKRIKETYAYPKHTFKTLSSFSILVDEISDVVQRHTIDMIITGTKGASGLKEVFMGSNTVRILKSIKNCPILAVPQQFSFVTPKEIAFATDFNRFYTLSELQPLLAMAKTFKAVIRIVHVQNKAVELTELQEFNRGMLQKYIGDVEYYFHTVTESNSISKALEAFTEELDIHLLAMLNFQHSYLEKMTREPVIKRVAFHTQVPLLVIPELGMGNPSQHHSKENEMTLSRGF